MTPGARNRGLRRFFGWSAAALVAFIALAAAFALQAPAFKNVKRDLAGHAIAAFLNRPVTIEGEVDIALTDFLKVRMADVRIGDAAGAEGLGHRFDRVEFSFSLRRLLAGHSVISGLVMSGARLDFTDDSGRPASADEPAMRTVLAAVPSDFLNSSVSDNFELRDIVVSFGNKAAGWAFDLAIAGLTTKDTRDGQNIELRFLGRMNDLPLSLSGHFAKPGSTALQGPARPFSLALTLGGVTSEMKGTLDVSRPLAVVDAGARVSFGSLAEMLRLFRIAHDGHGYGELTGRISGPLDGVRLDDAKFQLSDRQGRRLTVNGTIANLGTGGGVDLAFAAMLSENTSSRPQAASFSRIDVSGVRGKVSGALDKLEVDDLFIATNFASAELHNIGPIGLGRAVRSPEGRLGFQQIRILQGPEREPVLDISGSVVDVFTFSGVDFAGGFNIRIAELLRPHLGPEGEQLGRFRGQFTASDAGGSFRLEEFSGAVVATDLIALSVQMVPPGEATEERRTYRIALNIPEFDAVARLLGRPVAVGAVGFSGRLSIRGTSPELNGTATVGHTSFAVVTEGAIENGNPFLSVAVSSDLLDLGDIWRAVEIYRVYSATDTEAVDIQLDDRFVAATRLALDVRVHRIRGIEDGVGNIQAKGRYESGILLLEPLRMRFIEGAIDVRLRADTNRKPTALAMRGGIEKLDLGRFLTLLGATPVMTGALSTTFDLSAHAASRAESAGSLDGSLKIEMWGGTVASRLIDLGGQNVVRWIFSKSTVTGEAALVCAVASMEIAHGQATVKPIVVETENVQVVGEGKIDLPAESLALSFRTRPKRRELVDVATAFDVSGPLSAPEVKITSGAGVGRFVGETVTAPFNIIDLILPDIIAGKKRQPCVLEDKP